MTKEEKLAFEYGRTFDTSIVGLASREEKANEKDNV